MNRKSPGLSTRTISAKKVSRPDMLHSDRRHDVEAAVTDRDRPLPIWSTRLPTSERRPHVIALEVGADQVLPAPAGSEVSPVPQPVRGKPPCTGAGARDI
jgi:hypothetical protein